MNWFFYHYWNNFFSLLFPLKSTLCDINIGQRFSTFFISWHTSTRYQNSAAHQQCIFALLTEKIGMILIIPIHTGWLLLCWLWLFFFFDKLRKKRPVPPIQVWHVVKTLATHLCAEARWLKVTDTGNPAFFRSVTFCLPFHFTGY